MEPGELEEAVEADLEGLFMGSCGRMLHYYVLHDLDEGVERYCIVYLGERSRLEKVADIRCIRVADAALYEETYNYVDRGGVEHVLAAAEVIVDGGSGACYKKLYVDASALARDMLYDLSTAGE